MMKSFLVSVAMLVAVSAYGAEINVSQFAVPAEDIGPDWSGPTGLVIDDLDAPPTVPEDMIDVIAGLQKQMKPLGIKATADFTYRRTSDPMQQVTLRVFAFTTKNLCKQWIETKYQFEGWEKKYKRLEEQDYVGFDSLEMKKRIVAIGDLWITAGTIGKDDDHLKILDLLLHRISQQEVKADQPVGDDGEPASHP